MTEQTPEILHALADGRLTDAGTEPIDPGAQPIDANQEASDSSMWDYSSVLDGWPAEPADEFVSEISEPEPSSKVEVEAEAEIEPEVEKDPEPIPASDAGPSNEDPDTPTTADTTTAPAIPRAPTRRPRLRARNERDANPSSIHPETVRILHAWMESPRLRGYIRSRIGSGTPTETVDDIRQEVCMALVKGWAHNPPDVTNETEEGAEDRRKLMFGIAANKVADHHRRKGRNRSEPMGDLPDPETTAGGADREFFTQWDKKHLWDIAAEVTDTPRQRNVFELMMVGGLKAEEKAKILGLTAAGVRIAEFRIRGKIRQRFQQQFGGEEIAYGYFVPAPTPEETAAARPKKRKSPTPAVRQTVSEVRDHSIEALHAACASEIAQGKGELSAHIPVYLGAWTAGMFALEQLRSKDAFQPSAIVFPHEQLLPDFRDYARTTLGPQIKFYRIETPETLAARLEAHPLELEHVLIPEDTDKALVDQLRANSSFILRLLRSTEQPPEVPGTFRATPYEEIGRKVLWMTEDSVTLLREWRFATGQELTAQTTKEMSTQRILPSYQRLTRDTTQAQLRARAGYSKKLKRQTD